MGEIVVDGDVVDFGYLFYVLSGVVEICECL